MGMHGGRILPTPEQLKAEYPLTDELVALKARRDAEIRDVLTGNSDKFLVIVGPCSADNEDSVCEYVDRLGELARLVSDRVVLIPRIYTTKPRTAGMGYKGMLHQPDPRSAPDLVGGIEAVRRMHVRAMERSGLTAADEMLYPENRAYLDDVLSYEAVGARSVENQQHRLMASGIDVPVGMKNPTSGDLTVMLNSVAAAHNPQRFIYRMREVSTDGNPLAHAVLRGGTDKYGAAVPNYRYDDCMRLWEAYRAQGLENPAVVIDANHANSDKKFKDQIGIVDEVMRMRKRSIDLREFVKGVMIESYLVEGCQEIGDAMTYGQSITDPCLGWDDTARLIREIADRC
ncbi:MAG: 3-deoxy-7-phosphoheptulonate synthase [Slackia sp.]|nr:3-deoxy-7-phosphoheptulonate synthase [Slackia sp.]